MARKLVQIRYYGSGNANNFPKNITVENLATGEIFKNYLPFYKIGVQSKEGTAIYLGDNINYNKTIVGRTGIFELEMIDRDKISVLKIEFPQ
jgi:hypothetical protein